MKCVIMILIGAPGAGKTTFARSLTDTQRNGLVYKFLHVEHDKLMPIRDLEQAPENQWKMDRSIVLEKIEKFLQELGCGSICFNGVHLSLEQDDRLIIVVDDNMYYKSMRQAYFRLAQTFNCGYCQVYFDIGMEVAISGNSQRSGRDRVPERVIRNIYGKIEPPVLSNYWERNSIVVLRRDLEVYKNDLFGMIDTCLEQPENLIEAKSNDLPCNSLCHDLDIVLRKLISGKISDAKGNMSKKELGVFSKKLAIIKGSILHDFKRGLLYVDPVISLETFAKDILSQKLVTNEPLA